MWGILDPEREPIVLVVLRDDAVVRESGPELVGGK